MLKDVCRFERDRTGDDYGRDLVVNTADRFRMKWHWYSPEPRRRKVAERTADDRRRVYFGTNKPKTVAACEQPDWRGAIVRHATSTDPACERRWPGSGDDAYLFVACAATGLPPGPVRSV
jgi:hypothetical protein